MPPRSRARVAFVTSHPIQYHTGWFAAVAGAGAMELEVLYCHDPAPVEQAAAGFGVPFSWDLPLLEGYRYRFLDNRASRPGLGTFAGLDTPELAAIIQSRRYDAVVVNGWHYKSAWQAIRAGWRARVPVLVRSDSHLHTSRSRLKMLVKSAPYRWFIGRLSGCLAVGRWSSDYFLHYDADPERVFVVPHAIDRSFARDAIQLATCREQFRERWRLPASGTIFLFAGKFIDKKRPLDFVRAIHHAWQQNPAIGGLMVGDGPLRLECERLVQQLQVPIVFAGFLNQSQMVPAYLAADAIVVPSNGEETWGLVVNEAMTCGRPALVSDRVGCGPDLVLHGETGFTFPLGDVAALGDLIALCAARPGQLAAMGRCARARMTDYSVTTAADRLTGAVSTVLSWA
jgi:glycosyltransferase involved in cell wall biosynthesis